MKVQKAVLVLMLGVNMGYPAKGLTADHKSLAKVGNEVISTDDMQIFLKGFNEGQKEAILKDKNSKNQIVESLIDLEVLAQEAQKKGLHQSAEYKNFQNAFRRNYLASRLLDEQVNPLLTSSAIKKYYETHKERFSTDQVHVQHILVSDEKQALKVIKLAQDPKSDFLNLAKKYSQDPSVETRRGDLGYINRGQYDPAFTEAAFQVEPGKVAGPVRTAYGYHIIKVIDRKPGRILEFNTDGVELEAKNALRQELVRSYTRDLRSKASVQQ